MSQDGQPTILIKVSHWGHVHVFAMYFLAHERLCDLLITLHNIVHRKVHLNQWVSFDLNPPCGQSIFHRKQTRQ